jgi:hypothetical protein
VNRPFVFRASDCVGDSELEFYSLLSSGILARA